MIRFILKIFLLIIVCSAYGQSADDYQSKEQIKYYKSRKFKPFNKVSKSEILKFKPSNCNIVGLNNYKAYESELYSTPYQDSVFKAFMSSDRLNQIENYKPDLIGNIDKSLIIKSDVKDSLHVFIYTDYKLHDRDYGDAGVWIAVSENYGKDWSYYFSGLVQRQPIYLKWYSKIPLLTEDNSIQIEAVLLQQQGPFIHPGPMPKYEIVKDGLSVIFDINDLKRDSDNDGLTDIMEKTLHLDLSDPDTDSDGLDDSSDLNPLYKYKQTDFSCIYEAVLNDYIPWDTVGLIVENEPLKEYRFNVDSCSTVLIVSDNLDIRRIQPKNTRVIFLTTNEYKKTKGKYKTDLKKMHITPLFKIDGFEDKYIISRSFGTGGSEYLVEKVKNGWRITLLSSWIS